MTKKRTLDTSLDVEDIIPIDQAAGSKKIKARDDAATEALSKDAGFEKRQVPKTISPPKKTTRRRSRRSPYTGQKLIRVRPEIAELFEDIAIAENIRDAELFEEALLTFIERNKMKEAAIQFKEILKLPQKK